MSVTDTWNSFRHTPSPPLPPRMPAFPPFTEADVFREAATLDHLADLTRELGSAWDAAVKKFGGTT